MKPRLIRGPLQLNELFELLEPTVTLEHVKLRTKRRVLTQVQTRTARLPRLVAAVVLLGAASAAAAGVRELVVAASPPAELPPRVLAGVPTPRPVVRVSSQSPPANSEPNMGTDSPKPEASVPSARVAKPQLARSAQTPKNARPSVDDPTHVVRALRALRQEGQPARAGALLERYLEEQPQGALAEEALALSIEAALSENSERASAFARRYLKSYPEGRYRSVARRALAKGR